jgi:DNA-binding GntR family transcriptional regulator
VPARHDDHELIIRALRDRDEAAARQAMESHIVGTVAIINTEARAAR